MGSNLPRVVVLATGGTIAGVGEVSAGVGSSAYRAGALPVERVLADVPGLSALARLRAETLFEIDSADMTDVQLLALARRVTALARRDDVDAIVVTHGTDTLEESAFLLHLTVASCKPVVITGAMLPATALSADGPRNLLDAVAVAAHPDSLGRGVQVVLGAEIFSGRDVRKVHSARTQAFASAWGPLGCVADGVPRWYRHVARRHTVDSEFIVDNMETLPLVGMVAGHASMRAEVIDGWLRADAQAIVLAGVGAGTVPQALRDALVALGERSVLLVRASATGAGPLVRDAAMGDDANGWVVADDQGPRQARVLAALALTRTRDPAQIQTMFFHY